MLLAAAAPRGPQNDLEDSWEVDFKGGRLIRHHRAYRKDWLVPDNSCPINIKKISSHVKVERVLPIAPYVASKQFNWRQQAPQKPDDLWVGKTIFYLRSIPQVSFDSQVQMIAVEPEGKGRKHAYLPRVYSETYATARDCPRPNPKDLTKAIVWAKQFERVSECMVNDIPASCHYECEEEGLMCEECEKTVRPSCAGLVPGLEFLADAGSEEDLLSKNDKQAHFLDIPIGAAARPVSLITANGPVQGNKTVKLDVPELGSTLECYVLESTPPVCSVGRRCMDEGFDFHWYAADSEAEAEPEPKDEKRSAQLKLEAESIEHKFIHRPKNPYCKVCQKAKMLAPHARKRGGSSTIMAKKFGDHVTIDHIITRDLRDFGIEGEKVALVVKDVYTNFRYVYPSSTKDGEQVYENLLHFFQVEDDVGITYSDNAPELEDATLQEVQDPPQHVTPLH